MNDEVTQIPLYERIPNNDAVAEWLAVGTLNGVVKKLLMRDGIITVNNEGVMIAQDVGIEPYRIRDEVARQIFAEAKGNVEVSIKLPKSEVKQDPLKGKRKGVNYMQRNGIKLSIKDEQHNIFACELYPATADKKIKDGSDESWEALTNQEVRTLIQVIETGILAS
ncbi:hypothetical protein A2X44_00145 [candidate division CPR3 bacterium GWF2_35_18]|uniref:Uncharacterized protein n=1 Tax=candidate division CPR3 bacterium GW2011_GWF2_35_18 TaxID=1618350 RepID=A0A0G0C206_UNCC3|nr:MAG: hypothetical protein UR67_C0001G0020 [candidate division CPR3 bacterium GW2011_GWF2_35_18]OGB63328.1 MAG: hypothetical protein A2X44_00145 [candidate division CPR3 bacterium GWF2_35_18]OGB65603.1 MAG: hypothetical protein A2250_02365 [candidate division CPR3 bacterium RIFOXYA2_FULL_35_13]OGB77119.1 MAG: hypothetical protein A2476_02310 [candidate division CPR3 bacterium RIFOXYC2_FULL_35_7]OGB79584.1 MAG: hypothetical protein A2296_03110 [candidate division CPR3 bacterium RIFOXYB2_FULL_3